MPAVLATGSTSGRLLACGARCWLWRTQHLDWPRDRTVGTHVSVSRERRLPAGFVLTARERCSSAVDGRKLRLTMVRGRRRPVDRIARAARTERAIIVRGTEFERRLQVEGRDGAE
jgi:fluoroacetyl-CoA thioesterase